MTLTDIAVEDITPAPEVKEDLSKEFELLLFVVGVIAFIFWMLMEFFPSFCNPHQKAPDGRSKK